MLIMLQLYMCNIPSSQSGLKKKTRHGSQNLQLISARSLQVESAGCQNYFHIGLNVRAPVSEGWKGDDGEKFWKSGVDMTEKQQPECWNWGY